LVAYQIIHETALQKWMDVLYNKRFRLLRGKFKNQYNNIES